MRTLSASSMAVCRPRITKVSRGGGGEEPADQSARGVVERAEAEPVAEEVGEFLAGAQ
jgi:hypothetical protein